MAIYHFDCKIISRSNGSNLLNSYAYQSCSKQHDETTGQTFDFTKKRGHVDGGVLLCKNAPERYKNAHVLLQEIEQLEKNKNAQLARRFEASLPNEFTHEQQMALKDDFFTNVFIKRGMIVVWDKHETYVPDEDRELIESNGLSVSDFYEPNDHIHWLTPMRAIDKNGNWEKKSMKAYLCRNAAGEEKYLTAAQFKMVSNEFEKVYKFKNENGEIFKLTPTEAKANSLENNRVDKHPVSKTIEITDWNAVDSLIDWRKEWAFYVNKHLELNGFEERVDHRSFKERGIEEEAQIHVGPDATAMERKEKLRLLREGRLNDYVPVTERGRINEQIKQLRKLVLELKELEVEKENVQNQISINLQQNYEHKFIVFKDMYEQNKTIFATEFEDWLPNESEYLKQLISKLDNYVYNSENVLERLKENANQENFAVNLDAFATYVDDKTIYEYEDIVTEKEKEISSFGNLENDYNQLKYDIRFLEQQRNDLGMFEFESKKKINAQIKEKEMLIINLEKQMNNILGEANIETKSKQTFHEKFESLIHFVRNQIKKINDLIERQEERICAIRNVILEVFNIDLISKHKKKTILDLNIEKVNIEKEPIIDEFEYEGISTPGRVKKDENVW